MVIIILPYSTAYLYISSFVFKSSDWLERKKLATFGIIVSPIIKKKIPHPIVIYTNKEKNLFASSLFFSPKSFEMIADPPEPNIKPNAPKIIKKGKIN